MNRYSRLVEQVRDAARPDRDPPPPMRSYLEKVRLHAFEVTDDDVEELKEAGFGDDEIFEHTVAAAVAAGLERLDAGLEALR